MLIGDHRHFPHPEKPRHGPHLSPGRRARHQGPHGRLPRDPGAPERPRGSPPAGAVLPCPGRARRSRPTSPRQRVPLLLRDARGGGTCSSRRATGVVDQVLADAASAPVTPKMKALLAIADKVRRDGRLVRTERRGEGEGREGRRPGDPPHGPDRRRVLHVQPLRRRPRNLAPDGPGRLRGVRGSAGRDRVRADRLQQVPGRLEAAVGEGAEQAKMRASLTSCQPRANPKYSVPRTLPGGYMSRIATVLLLTVLAVLAPREASALITGGDRQHPAPRPGWPTGRGGDLQSRGPHRLVGGPALRRRPVACRVPGRRQGSERRSGRLRQAGREGQADRCP